MLKNTTLLEISIIVTLVFQTIALSFLPIFSLALKTFNDHVNQNSTVGGYDKQDVLYLIGVAKKIVFFLLGVYCLGFCLTIFMVYHIHLSKIKNKKLSKLVCYIFVIFSSITCFVGGILFVLWYSNVRKD